jgi:hypothetical protein
MTVDGAEEGQLKGPIDFLAPYSSTTSSQSSSRQWIVQTLVGS